MKALTPRAGPCGPSWAPTYPPPKAATTSGTGTFWYIILMPSFDACSASGMIEASPGWPIIAMPAGLAATASRSCCTIFSIAQPEKT